MIYVHILKTYGRVDTSRHVSRLYHLIYTYGDNEGLG